MLVLLVLTISCTNYSLKILRINSLPVSALHWFSSNTGTKWYAFIISGGAQIILYVYLHAHKTVSLLKATAQMWGRAIPSSNGPMKDGSSHLTTSSSFLPILSVACFHRSPFSSIRYVQTLRKASDPRKEVLADCILLLSAIAVVSVKLLQ